MTTAWSWDCNVRANPNPSALCPWSLSALGAAGGRGAVISCVYFGLFGCFILDFIICMWVYYAQPQFHIVMEFQIKDKEKIK